MCGRFEQKSSTAVIARDFRITGASIDIKPRYNIAPTQEVLIVRIDEKGFRRLDTCRWGFVPQLVSGTAAAGPTINARAETVATKPMFRCAFAERRCLVIATGFYEWQTTGKTRVPYYVSLTSGSPFGLAGIYNPGRVGPGAGGICTCAIITTASNDTVGRIHNRMPVIVPKEDWDLWLDPRAKDTGTLVKLLRPYPSELMSLHQVSARVNHPSYDSPDAAEPV